MTAASARPTAALRADPRQAPSARHAQTLAGRVGIVLGGWTLALYFLTFLVVRQHYREFPPHYDSIGLFADLFELLNLAPTVDVPLLLPKAFGTGLVLVAAGLRSALAWAPIKSPEALVSLNFVLLLAAQAAIVTYGRTFGWGPLRQVVAATLPIVPGALYAWDGGIQDLRRDVQLVLLALAILFLSLAYVTSPDWRRGLALGHPGRPRPVVARQRSVRHPDRRAAGHRAGRRPGTAHGWRRLCCCASRPCPSPSSC